MPQMQDLPPEQDSPRSLLGVLEVARLVHKDTTTVQRWARSGKLPIAHRMPGATGALLFRREDVEALAKEPAA